MRIYQRGVDESLMIGEDVVVTVVEVLPDGVRLGISDPHSIPSYWEETVFLEESSCSSPVLAHAHPF